ncbi:MAG: hypothetical protein EA397_05660 [Deltaproteobacteria bacterium]|nr:MAG: hypothetical protein EA397_05660 [Deltaproteobacteria bacterium]
MPRPFALALLLSACPSAPAEPPPAETGAEVAFDLDNPESCAACHGAIHAEWQGSMHAQAHHDKDPIYHALRSFRMERQGEGIGPKCASCHHPRETEALESDLAKQGVSCATCHNLDQVKREEGVQGAEALVWGEPGVVRGPHGADGSAAPHGIGEAAPWLTDGVTLCLACHAAAENPKGVATCTTGAEYADAKDAASCTSCHMPEVEGPSGSASTRESHRSHAFLGPHSLWDGGNRAFMGSALEIEGELKGTQARLTLINKTSHGFPSGFPGRVAIIQAVGMDDEGNVHWSNFSKDPMAEDPQSVLNKVYVDDEGKPILPPFATKLARDHRLKPDERRELSWTDLPEQVQTLKVSVRFHLIPPPAVELLKLQDSPLAHPRPMKSARIDRTEP